MSRLIALLACLAFAAGPSTAFAYPYEPPAPKCYWIYINQYNGWWYCP